MVSRMKRLRILPEIWARTRCSLARATRNMVPGNTDMIVPSTAIDFSEFKISTLRLVGREQRGSENCQSRLCNQFRIYR
jgi:hypothetical protein